MSNSGIPGYKILKSIGKGGTAQVFLAIQISVGRTVAIKVLSSECSQDTNFSYQFLKEANCGVLNHPNIITIHDAGESNGHLYIAMEHLQGGDLKQKMLKGIEEDEVIRIISQIAEALSHAHNNSFTHRDIKPGNILFDEHDNAILADFGIAKTVRFSHQDSIINGFVGTPNYISPEQVSDQPVDHRSDLYSLGVVYYEILTGVKPFVADSTYTLIFKHLKDPVPPLESKFEKHQPIISKLLEKKPAKRFQSADELITELNKINTTKTVTPVVKPPTNTLRNFSVLVAVLIAFSSVVYTQFKPERVKLHIPESVAIKSSLDREIIEKLEQDIKKTVQQKLLLEQEQLNLKTITSHLTNASKYLGLDQLTSPEKENALYEYRQVLLLDKNNPQAQYGIQYIINHYRQLALIEKKNKNYDTSLAHVNTGLSIDANNTEFLELTDELNAIFKDQSESQKITSGLKRADRLISKHQLNDAKLELKELNRLYKNNEKIIAKLAKLNKRIKRSKYIGHTIKLSTDLLNESPVSEPNISQACESSYALLKLEPDNSEVNNTIKACAYRYLELAQQADSTDAAVELVETGLYYSPNNPQLSIYLQELLTS